MDLKVALGKALRSARKQRGLSQEGLALEAGTQRNYVSIIERGGSSPTVGMLDKLCAVLKIPVSVLFAQAETLRDKSQDK